MRLQHSRKATSNSEITVSEIDKQLIWAPRKIPGSEPLRKLRLNAFRLELFGVTGRGKRWFDKLLGWDLGPWRQQKSLAFESAMFTVLIRRSTNGLDISAISRS